MKSLLEILTDSAGYLAKHQVEGARLEAEWLLAHVLGLRRVMLYVQFDRPLTEPELAKLRPLLRRRAGGEPLQYILGTAPFYDIELEVGPGVLIPRPETERLVDLALGLFPDAATTGPLLDLCTGTGAIVLALAKARPLVPRLVGVEREDAAFAWARRNLARLNLPQVELRQGDLYAPVAGERFAVITANPPYVTTTEMGELPRDVREYEPATALAAGAEGLDVTRRIVAAAPDHLLPAGWLLLEIGASQGPAVRTLLTERGFTAVKVVQDYCQRDRVVMGQWPG